MPPRLGCATRAMASPSSRSARTREALTTQRTFMRPKSPHTGPRRLGTASVTAVASSRGVTGPPLRRRLARSVARAVATDSTRTPGGGSAVMARSRAARRRA
jgi:hypothetical protein